MNKFNLTFWGEILAGRDPRKVKARFAKMFSIDDPERVEHFFSGDTIILRRNLERKVAAEYYSKLRKLGVEARLVKVDPTSVESTPARDAPPPATEPAVDGKGDWEKARRAAEIEAQQRKAQRAAEREAARRQAEAAAAKHKAEQEALQRQRAEAEARRAREAETRAREQAEAQTRREAELEARRQRQAREAAKRKAAREEAKRREAEEAARRKAELDKQKRIAREQAAAEKARKAEEKRKTAEAKAKQQALEAEQKRQEELCRKEQMAREKAQREAEAARLRGEREAAQREEKARREAERARIAEEREQARAEREHRQAQEKHRAEEQRLAEEARLLEQETQRQLMEEQAIARAAEELSDMAALKSTQGKVTSSMELPRRSTLPAKARRQAGAPNFYSMYPFRNTSAVRERAAIARRKKFSGLVSAAVALAALMMLTGRYLDREPARQVTGPSAIAAAPSGALLMLAGDNILLHDRAGVGTQSIPLSDSGIPGAVLPITYDASGDLLLHASPASGADNLIQLHRCSGDFASCKPVPVEGRADAMTTHPLTREIFLARGGTLARYSTSGELLAQVELPLPDNPVMTLDSGLLFINSSQGPAISVYRYEDNAFGKQLDEVLLLPPPAMEKEQTRVRDFVRAGSNWWVSLENPEADSTGLYLFDSNWNYIMEVDPGNGWHRGRLLSWGRKVLLWKNDAATIRRFAGNGHPEVELQSDLLGSLMQQQARSTRLKNLAWAAGFSLLIAIAVIGAALGYHQYLRSLVYHSRPTRGAEPVDEYTENIQWIDPASDRAAAIKRLWLYYGAFAAAVFMLCIGLGVDLSLLAAALITLAGPAIALALLARSQPAHIGTLAEELILVDHRQMYHVGSGPRIQYRGPFLLIDDVVVFTGTGALPAFDREQLTASVAPVANAGARVDRKTVLVKLLDARHPMAHAAISIGVALLGAFIALAAGQFL